MTDAQKLTDILAEARRSAERASSSAQDAASEASDAQDYASSATDSANSAESHADEVQEALDSVEEMVAEVVAENERLTAIIAKIRTALEDNADQSDVLELAESATEVVA
jgi:methyl-accepting chemotaxis protein